MKNYFWPQIFIFSEDPIIISHHHIIEIWKFIKICSINSLNLLTISALEFTRFHWKFHHWGCLGSLCFTIAHCKNVDDKVSTAYWNRFWSPTTVFMFWSGPESQPSPPETLQCENPMVLTWLGLDLDFSKSSPSLVLVWKHPLCTTVHIRRCNVKSHWKIQGRNSTPE